MLSLDEGILAFSVRRQAPKIYEIYDRLMCGALGQQSDVESLRVAAIEFAHQEGFNRSEDDVTIARVVAAISGPMKRAFADFNTVPYVVQALFAEVGETLEEDSYYLLDSDGDYSVHRKIGYLSADPDGTSKIYDGLNAIKTKGLTPKAAIDELKTVWTVVLSGNEKASFDELTKNLTLDVALLRRERGLESPFTRNF